MPIPCITFSNGSHGLIPYVLCIFTQSRLKTASVLGEGYWQPGRITCFQSRAIGGRVAKTVTQGITGGGTGKIIGYSPYFTGPRSC